MTTIQYTLYPSPNFDNIKISVEFLLIHYTAGRVDRALEILTSSEWGVSSHLLIDVTGEIYELVPCLEGNALRAFHAGRSFWFDGTRRWEAFNNFSIGIELVNLNGNLLPYTEEQYHSLVEVTRRLAQLYPQLRDPNRVLGHEQVASWRGKVDPGRTFDWIKFFADCYPKMNAPERKYTLPDDLIHSLSKFLELERENPSQETALFHAISHTMETSMRLINSGSTGSVRVAKKVRET